MSTTTTRYIGTCTACQRQIKVRDGRLVHHGYQRPGHGHIEGDCFGVGYEPHEVSPKLAKDYLAMVKLSIKEREAHIVRLEAMLEELPKWPKTPDYDRERHLKNVRYQAQSILEWARDEVPRLEALIQAWEPRDLVSVEEEKAQKQAAKADRDAAREAKRQAKVAEQVAKYQKRIDSAERRMNLKAIAEIFDSAPRKFQDLKVSREEGFKLIDRDHVWRKMGLLTEEGYFQGSVNSYSYEGVKTWPVSV